MPWPRPALGKWENAGRLRDRDEQAAGLCQWLLLRPAGDLRGKEDALPAAIDLYDLAGGLYKLWLGLQTPLRVPDTGAALGVNNGTELLVVNFKDKHLTVATAAHPCFNTDCNAQYLDAGRYASPQGLSKIAQ